MSRQLIVEGDPIDHGGQVLAGCPRNRIGGRAIARLGDPVWCLQHGPTVIVEGCASACIDGRPLALAGHRTACGATLIGSSGALVE